MRPKVYLVGQGPGDPGLLTVRAARLLRQAQAVVYDGANAPHALWSLVPPQAQLVPVEGLAPAQVADRLLELAAGAQVVIRLYPGDPLFLGGPGSEEARLLAARDVDVVVVPGVPLPAAAWATCGLVPRGAGLWTLRPLGADLPALVWASAARADEVARALLAAGLPPDTRCTALDPRAAGAADSLAQLAERPERPSEERPLFLLLGDLPRLPARRGPLAGLRVLITRALDQAEELAELLADQGAETFLFPAIRLAAPSHPEAVDEAIAAVRSYQWLVFTSANAVRLFLGRLAALGRDIRDLTGVRLVAIGPKTAAALRAVGLVPVAVPPEYRGEAVVEAMRPLLAPGERVLLPRAEDARPALPDGLRALGAQVCEVGLYRTVPSGQDATWLRALLAAGRIDLVTFTSPSTVDGLLAAVDADLLARVPAACIGPVTAARASSRGLKVAVVAQTYTAEGLVAALVASRSPSGDPA